MKIGVFAIGLEAYWPQFEKLKSNLEEYSSIVYESIRAIHPDVVNAGLVDNTDKAFDAGKLFHREDVDIIFLYVATYALSSTVLSVVQRARVPVIILNLSPEAAIDYDSFNKLNSRKEMTGKWLEYCNACPVPEITNVFRRCGIRFHQITGLIQNDPIAWNEIKEWIEAAKVVDTMRNNRMGCIGHYYSGMLDIYTDLTLQIATFGGHAELIEVDELSALREDATERQIKEKVRCFLESFDVQSDCSEAELKRAAITSVALDKLIEK